MPNGTRLSLVESFAAELRRLRARAGNPSYKSMSLQAHYSIAVLSRADSGEKLPTWEVAEKYILACGGNPQKLHEKWKSARAESRRGDDGREAAPVRSLRSIRRASEFLAALRWHRIKKDISYSALAQKTGLPKATLHAVLHAESVKPEPLRVIVDCLFTQGSKEHADAVHVLDRIAGQTRPPRSALVLLVLALGVGTVVAAVTSAAGKAQPPATSVVSPRQPTASANLPAGADGITIKAPHDLAVENRGSVKMLRQPLSVQVFSRATGWRPVRRPVPSPCGYYEVWTGKELATQAARAEAATPNVGNYSDSTVSAIIYGLDRETRVQVVLPPAIRAIEHIENASNNNPYDSQGAPIDAAAIAEHRHDTRGHWWLYRCDVSLIGATGAGVTRSLLTEWHAQVVNQWQFWQPGQERFPAGVRIDPLTVIANLQAVVPGLAVHFDPAPANTTADVMTWTSVADLSRGPVKLQIGSGADTVTAEAHPGRLLATPMAAADPRINLAYFKCARGGAQYSPEVFRHVSANSDVWCGLLFGAVGTYRLRFNQNWTLTIDGGPVRIPNATLIQTSPEYVFNVGPLETAPRSHL